MPALIRLSLVLALLLLAGGCASTANARRGAGERVERGLVSYYADALHGRPTASGERYDRALATCAHRTHPFGTRLVVTLLDGSARVTCRVNDRGPFVKGRVVDVSGRLARELGIVKAGLAEATVEVAP